ncbi:Oidioi.mRNA.OKI2018_I69.PAR.g11863.t1.cds [Oikopleura dioica]|uniref:Oidioi.mRNA.OKI2018_I69.PAR.g11863.t1.cds n=1 Tax=Oikopleura dioica TaxID=34765 RepID=A0ABN7RXN5_OIKDI|nr:Oidioi.mRNA.OKI2018_I69.PAR.g11863.t1.cds [Oikopleura dioica]
MKLLGALLLLTPPEVECKDIKQKMMENRLKFDRDVVIHGDEEEDDWDPWDLEDDELQARLRKLVVRMDHNRDGYVDQEELTSWSLGAVYNLESENLSLEFHSHIHIGRGGFPDDFAAKKEAGDYTVNWKEYVFTNWNIHIDDEDHVAKPRSKSEDQILKFNQRNNEYNKIDQKAVLAEALNSVDTDGDGKISLQEYLKDWHQTPSNVDEEFMELETDRFKDEYDRDSNGFIEADELIFWLSPDNTEIAIDEAEHLIDMCDEDEDERLTPDEIVDNHDLWVDSDATEYGAQLRHYDEL